MMEMLLLCGLATQRLTFLWLYGRIFEEARKGFSSLGQQVKYFVHCPYCISVWFAAYLITIWHLSWLGQLIVWALAISTCGGLFNLAYQSAEQYVEKSELYLRGARIQTEKFVIAHIQAQNQAAVDARRKSEEKS